MKQTFMRRMLSGHRNGCFVRSNDRIVMARFKDDVTTRLSQKKGSIPSGRLFNDCEYARNYRLVVDQSIVLVPFVV